MEQKNRCFGSGKGKEFYAEYHDKEWGVPVYDDRHLFEMLILEGAQAGLSWEIILKRREEYRKAFHHFDPVKVAKMSDKELHAVLKNPGIIRNRLKVYAARQNAQVFLEIQKEFGAFSSYVWSFVGGKPIVTRRKSLKEVPCFTPVSDTLSKDLKKRGMTFVGSKIMYSFMQAVGLVNDHLVDCFCSKKTGSVVVDGVYEHYKGMRYQVMAVARHSETLEDLVVYRALYGEGEVWARPLKMFLENVKVKGKLCPRFVKLRS